MIILLALLVPLCYVGFYALAGILQGQRFRQVANAATLLLPLCVFATGLPLVWQIAAALVMGLSLLLGSRWAVHIRRKQGRAI